MALAKTHDILNFLAAPLFLYFLPQEAYFPFLVGYIAGTLFLSPDLDLSNSKPSKRWRFLRCIWLPYQNLFRHRGVSHIPLLGSLIRILYLTMVTLFLYFTLLGVISSLNLTLSKTVLNVNPLEVLDKLFRSDSALYAVMGIICADLVHITVDFFSSTVKRFLK